MKNEEGFSYQNLTMHDRTLLHGPSGSGKSSLAMSYAVSKATEGEKVLILGRPENLEIRFPLPVFSNDNSVRTTQFQGICHFYRHHSLPSSGKRSNINIKKASLSKLREQ